jgi:lipoxygenase homology domain-containing protein 1
LCFTLILKLYFHFLKAEYTLSVTTGSKIGSGTDANVFIIIYGENTKTEKIPLKKDSGDPFEKGKTDIIKMKGLNVGEIKKINISHDGKSIGDGWYLEQILISIGEKSYMLV